MKNWFFTRNAQLHRMVFLLLTVFLLNSVEIIATPPRYGSNFYGDKDVQQQRTVTGVVTDEKGEPLPGVTIVLKSNPTKGTTTDFDGNYSISVQSSDVLVFTYIGFVKQEIAVGSKRIINVVMVEEAEQLGDVVVVGHGTQKKIAISGAVTSVKGTELKMPSSSLTSAFAGQLAGVIAMTRSGEPGAASDFYIRGISTFGGRATPLIMLDDVEISATDLNNIPPETIESFTVLKDASATAIYGSRGANGVMIVKTKTGKKNEKTRIGVTFDQSINIPRNFPKFVDGATWMELYNEALITRNPSATPKYSQQVIDATRSGVNPYVYPDVNWQDVLFRDMAINHRANINMQGGGDKATYYMSIQANHDEGLLKTQKLYSWDNNISNWAYNFQNNISYDLGASTNIELKMNAQIREKEGPNFDSLQAFFGNMLTSNPINFPVTFPAQPGDRHLRFGNNFITGTTYRVNPYALLQTSFKETRENTINTSLKVNQKLDFITSGLKGGVLVNFKNWSMNSYHQLIEPYYYRVTDGSYNPLTQDFEVERVGTSGTDYISTSALGLGGDQTFVLQATLDYARKVGAHDFSGMILYHQREYKNAILPHRNQGVSSRLMYNYDAKYFAEFNVGYTGTERLQKGSRFDIFPAVSLGWVVSDENFFTPVKDVLSFLKLRGSYGISGSDETGLLAGAPHFLYLQDVTLNDQNMGYTTGEELGETHRGPQMLQWAIENGRWEKVKRLNIGTDLKLFDFLNITADYFSDKRYDILLKREAWPQSLGYHEAKPWSNKGKVDNWGYDININASKQLTDNLTVGIRLNYTYNQNKLTDVDDPVYKYPWQARTGRPISYVEGYIAEGLFTSQEEIDNSPVQNLGSTPMPGDIKYRDINGDGMITDEDKTMISPYGDVPRIQYGFGVNIAYKRVTFDLFFSGSAKRTIVTGLQDPLGQNDNNIFQHIADNRWTESNPNPNATYPRLGIQTTEVANNRPTSTYWMRNGSFLRLKQAQIGYNFKYGKVFVEGNNLLLFSKFKQWDPELHWSAYPLQQVYNLGVQLNF